MYPISAVMAVAETREASFNRKWKVETFNSRKFAAQNFTLLIRTANSWPRGGRAVLDRALGQSGHALYRALCGS